MAVGKYQLEWCAQICEHRVSFTISALDTLIYVNELVQLPEEMLPLFEDSAHKLTRIE